MRVWLNGRVLPLEQARVSVLDHGLTVGDGVFETLQILRGQPFAPTRHIARLRRSAQALGLPDPDPELLAAAMADVVAANRDLPASAGRLRLTYTSGEGPLGSDRGTGPVTLCAVAAPATPWPPTATVATVPWCRNERSPLAGVKSTSYAENAVALARAKRQGAGEALLANTRGELCEGTGSNIFLLLDGALVTPPVSSGCLPGITRELVLEWLGGHEEAVPMAQLPGAEEMFLTSSTRNVHPISRVDVSELSTTRGETLAREFAARMLDEPDP